MRVNSLSCARPLPRANTCFRGPFDAKLRNKRIHVSRVPLESLESYQGGSVLSSQQGSMAMKILAIDLGKYNSVACNYVTTTGTARFATVVTHVLELDRLLVGKAPIWWSSRPARSLVGCTICAASGA